MRLVIDGIDNVNSSPIEFMLCLEMQRNISEYYNVYPVISMKQKEEFIIDSRETEIIEHHMFAVCAKGRLTDENLLKKLAKKLWETVNLSFCAGALVMYRRIPEFSEHNYSDDDWIVKMSVRIGSNSPCLVDSVPEGGIVPRI